ncbi:MAG: hypothetical protein QNJ55_17340 [Xenococcus sp. MO_188.B8]|nr:hypothetical protein [Xenococcus sp. MO_188.B8]
MTRQSILTPVIYLNGKSITRELILELLERHDFIYSQAVLVIYLLRLGAVSSERHPIGINDVINWRIKSKQQWDDRKQEIFCQYGFDKKSLRSRKEIITKKKEVKSLLKEKMIENILSQLREAE